jgi:hypothetical protein
MNWKELLKSKTFWAGIAGIATGVGLVMSGDKSGYNVIVTSLIGIFIRDALITK